MKRFCVFLIIIAACVAVPIASLGGTLPTVEKELKLIEFKVKAQVPKGWGESYTRGLDQWTFMKSPDTFLTIAVLLPLQEGLECVDYAACCPGLTWVNGTCQTNCP
jgi:hypothetical protein